MGKIYIQAAEQISIQNPFSEEWMEQPITYAEPFEKAVNPAFREYIAPNEARRMGSIMKRALVTSLKVLKETGIEHPDAIITGTALGCLENSELLLRQMVEEGETMLKPTYFMQSTHNTISSNIAIRLGCHGYNITYTQDQASFDWAIRDAELLLKSGKCKTVLVGCHDESTPLYRQLMQRLGYDDIPSVNSKAIVLSCGK